ncbi:MAG: hypothetical protein LC737_05795, partial [Chloroflexi bacterium]|nr:hypothetical protein [Chloroflexota bacterium]
MQFWLLRPLERDDFLQLCQTENINLTRDDLEGLTVSQCLHPLISGARTDLYDVVQVFALSAVWSDQRAQKLSEPDTLRQALDASIQTVWTQLAFLTPDHERLNGNNWLALTQFARDQRERIAQHPAQRLWIDGLANLAASNLFAIGVRPVAVTGRPRIAPTDPVLLTLDEMVQRYYEEKQTFVGCFPLLRRNTLDERDQSKFMAFVREWAPRVSVSLTDAEEFYRAWQNKLGTSRTLERAIEEIRATLETLPDEAQAASAMFAFERMAAQLDVPLSADMIPTDSLSEDVLDYAEPLADGPATTVGGWDTHTWQWWLIPRRLLCQRFAPHLLR